MHNRLRTQLCDGIIASILPVSLSIRRKDTEFVQLLRNLSGVAAALCLAVIPPALAAGRVDVLTQHNDNFRSGANNAERILNTSNVNVDSFGKLFSRQVDGCIYAQPLVAMGVKVNGHHRDIVYVATEHNSIYAFDAVDPAASTPIWHVNLGPSISSHDFDGGPYGTYHDMIPEIGTTGTPVIDRTSQTLYVVAKTKEDGVYHLRLHALDMTTGQERPGSPVEVTATIPGTGDGSVNGKLTVDPWKQMNRPGLLLLNGVVYVALGAHADFPPYHGWLLGYDAATLRPVSIFNATPDAADGGLWASGNGPSVDPDGDIWVATGNGTADVATGGRDYGESFIRLDPRKGLQPIDWMTPHDQEELNAKDADLGSSGPVYVAGPNVVVGGGKGGVLYVLDPEHAGRFHPDKDDVLQSFAVSTGGHIHGSVVYWNSPRGVMIYVWPEEQHLKAFLFDGRHLGETPVSISDVLVPYGMPGGFLSISSDGGKAGTGILWAMHSYQGDAIHQTVPGIVDAFDASDLKHELWNSKQDAARDDIGMFAKHSSLTVANGRVYVPTFSNQLVVFGLLPDDKRGAPAGTPSPAQSDDQPSNGNPPGS